MLTRLTAGTNVSDEIYMRCQVSPDKEGFDTALLVEHDLQRVLANAYSTLMI